MNADKKEKLGRRKWEDLGEAKKKIWKMLSLVYISCNEVFTWQRTDDDVCNALLRKGLTLQDI